jgi:hypothetical protein
MNKDVPDSGTGIRLNVTGASTRRRTQRVFTEPDGGSCEPAH